MDFRISRDVFKIFCINKKFIQAWDMWTGKAMGKANIRDHHVRVYFLAMEGSRVWMRPLGIHYIGWDFGIPESPPVELFTPPPDRLNLSNTKLWDNSLCRIQDKVTGKVVFQLSEASQSCVVEVQWTGKYLAVSLKSEKELILGFHPTFLQ